MNKALLLVDIQVDFCPGGALEVENGHKVVPVANKLSEKFNLVIATKDWHPANHGSFAANHPWRKPGQVIDLNGLEQILWPIHCVQETFGSEFAPDLNTDRIQEVFYKGTDPGIDSYSGFFDNGHRRATGLGDYLKERNVKEVYLVGLALDVCIKYTALDAAELGFDTFLVSDGSYAVNVNEGDGEKAIEEMKEKGVRLIRSEEVAL